MSSFLLIDIGNSRLKWASVDGKRNPIERDKKLWDHSGAIDTKLLGSKEHRD
ncbi:MAG: type III pantothenate kinase, partial [Burkholderiaceae bacterium]|nr:type III pantothenate kinase [Burkholderiaceae bacterium]